MRHPFTISTDAPAIPPLNKSEEEINHVLAAKTARRELFIQSRIDAGESRIDAAIEYDMELTPLTTNARQLEEIGVSIPEADDIPDLPEEEVHRHLWSIIYGLARLGIFLKGTNPFTDRRLLYSMVTSVLIEEINDIPPNPDMTEFVDFSSRSRGLDIVQRDNLLPVSAR